MKIHTRAFALASGIYTGVLLFLFVWKLIVLGGPLRKTTLLGRVFPDVRITPLWSIAGLAGGFIDGCIIGALFSSMYNRLVDVFGGGEEEDREKRHYHRHEHEHAPWLFALAHRVPGIHA